jgi:hypothetical protein
VLVYRSDELCCRILPYIFKIITYISYSSYKLQQTRRDVINENRFCTFMVLVFFTYTPARARERASERASERERECVCVSVHLLCV